MTYYRCPRCGKDALQSKSIEDGDFNIIKIQCQSCGYEIHDILKMRMISISGRY